MPRLHSWLLSSRPSYNLAIPQSEEMMPAPAKTPMDELLAVLGRYDHKFDEPNTICLMAKAREEGLIDDGEWKDVLRWLDEAMVELKEPAPMDKIGRVMIDYGTRNADWIRIVHAQRLAGYLMPHWASLWLWWIGSDREEGTWWKQIGAIAKAMRLPRFEEARR